MAQLVDPLLSIGAGAVGGDFEAADEEVDNIGKFELAAGEAVPEEERSGIEGDDGGEVARIASLDEDDILVGDMVYFILRFDFHGDERIRKRSRCGSRR